MNDAIRRVLTAVVAAPVVIGLAYVGGWAFALLVAAIGCVAQAEFYAMARATGVEPQWGFGLGLGALFVLGFVASGAWALALVLLVGLVAAGPFVFPRAGFLPNLAVTIAGALYPAGLLGTLVGLREARSLHVDDVGAFLLVLLTLFLVWATDIAAYYVGKHLGRRPLAPEISPNKTWEGALGGAAAALLVAVVFKLAALEGMVWGDVIIIALICGGVSQAGDLAESQLKRSTGMKDAGRILPGHGGLFDRFDAMVVAAPLVYVHLNYVSNLF